MQTAGLKILSHTPIKTHTMEKRKSRVSGWLIVGVLVLIALLIIWLTVADLFGDTDVAAQIFIPEQGSWATTLQ